MSFQLPFYFSPELIKYLIISSIASFIASIIAEFILERSGFDVSESAKEFVLRTFIFFVLFFFLFLIVIPAIEWLLSGDLFAF